MDDYRSGHRQRIKKKYLEIGPQAFNEEYELLELLLTFSIPRRDCKSIAKELLEKFGSISNVLHESKENLESVSGVKDNSYVLFKLVLDLNKYILKENRLKETYINGTHDLVNYLKQDIGFVKKEVFKVIFLDNKNKFLEEETLFKGTLDRSHIYPRELVEKIFKHSAKSVIFSHNHPSGDLTPSKQDVNFTNSMKKLLKELDIRLLDHIIIGRNSYFSFLENGLLED